MSVLILDPSLMPYNNYYRRVWHQSIFFARALREERKRDGEQRIFYSRADGAENRLLFATNRNRLLSSIVEGIESEVTYRILSPTLAS